MTIIYFIIILSVTVFVHELGHFIFAKKAGIHVYEFCIGMGPRIFKFKRKNDETEYGIRILPIGGFCSMAGEDVEVDEEVPVEKRMQSKTWPQRFFTIVAGVMFNFIFAFLILLLVGWLNGNPNSKPIISGISEDSPASISGLKAGDVITKVNGVKVNSIDRLMIEYTVHYGNTIEFTLSNGNVVSIIPEKTDDQYTYGFILDNTIKTGFFEGIKYAFTKFFSLINQMFIIIGYLCMGKISLNSLSGPIGIYNIVGQSVKAGIINVLYLVGYLSINVGFINLLPIPAFDGGRALFLIIEKIRRKPIKPEIENRIHAVGFVLLMLLMVIITYNDIVRFIIS